jgi:hypothetical protein
MALERLEETDEAALAALEEAEDILVECLPD